MIDKESGFEKGSEEYWNFNTERIRLGYKIINEHDPVEKARKIQLELEKSTSLASSRALAQVLETDRQLNEIHLKLNPTTGQIPRPTILQGGIRPPTQGLHTPTMAEIIQQANQRDPTQPYFDTNSDHMRMIDPLAEHTIFSGEGVRTVNPLKPGPKMGGPS